MSIQISEFNPYIERIKEFINHTQELPPVPKELLERSVELYNKLKTQKDNHLVIEYLKTLDRIKEINNNCDFVHFILIFKKYKIDKILYNILTSPYTNGLPTITYLITKYDDITKAITDPDEYMFCQKLDYLPNLVKNETKRLSAPVNIPDYNLLHIGTICHFNVCINMLTSFTYLIKEFTKILEQDKDPILAAKWLHKILLNAHSYIDLNPTLLPKLLFELKISISNIEEAAETMKKILNVMYETANAQNINLKNTLFFWDTSIENDTPLFQLIHKYNPIYLVLNIHDFNVVNKIDSNKVEFQEFDVKDENGTLISSYKLTSYVLFNNGHYINVFIKDLDKQEVVIKDDLLPRYEMKISKVGNTFLPSSQHTLASYVRKDMF